MPHSPLYSPYGAFELKRSYQRNMLLGIASTVVLVFLFVLPLLWSERVQHREETSVAFKPDSTFHVTDPQHEKPKPVKRAAYGLNPYERQHQGFMGFNGFRIVYDLPQVAEVIETPKVLSQTPTLIEPDSAVSYSDLASDTGIGVYAPDLGDYLPEDTAPAVLFDREVQVITRVDPEYPLVAVEKHVEGEIAVVVYIDSMGQLSTYPEWLQGNFKTLEYSVDGDKRVINYAMREEPTDWFFGKNFLKVLPKWEFLPRIEKGLAVGSVLTIKYYYCFGVHCLRYELISQKD